MIDASNVTPLSPDDLDDMERRFPPTELNFAEAMDQIRAGREVARAEHADLMEEIGASLPMAVDTADLNATDWVITG